MAKNRTEKRESIENTFVDRIVIAQALADRATLVSSDGKMGRYRRDGLDFVFNQR